MATDVEKNKTYYVYFEIFNQIKLYRYMCFTMNEIPFNEVTETSCPDCSAGSILDNIEKFDTLLCRYRYFDTFDT